MAWFSTADCLLKWHSCPPPDQTLVLNVEGICLLCNTYLPFRRLCAATIAVRTAGETHDGGGGLVTVYFEVTGDH